MRVAVQRSENRRKNSFLNYETVALPAELRRRDKLPKIVPATG
jgi:hypothetical protein